MCLTVKHVQLSVKSAISDLCRLITFIAECSCVSKYVLIKGYAYVEAINIDFLLRRCD